MAAILLVMAGIAPGVGETEECRMRILLSTRQSLNPQSPHTRDS